MQPVPSPVTRGQESSIRGHDRAVEGAVCHCLSHPSQPLFLPSSSSSLLVLELNKKRAVDSGGMKRTSHKFNHTAPIRSCTGEAHDRTPLSLVLLPSVHVKNVFVSWTYSTKEVEQNRKWHHHLVTICNSGTTAKEFRVVVFFHPLDGRVLFCGSLVRWLGR